MTRLNRRQFLAAASGALGGTATGTLLTGYVWPHLNKEDLIPGTAPETTLQPEAWEVAPDRLRFAALGDNGSGGRQAMAAAGQMAKTYSEDPFGLVALLGDIRG